MADCKAVCVCGIDVSSQSNTQPNNVWAIHILVAMVICSAAAFGARCCLCLDLFTHDLRTMFQTLFSCKTPGQIFSCALVSAPRSLVGTWRRGHVNCLQIDANFTWLNNTQCFLVFRYKHIWAWNLPRLQQTAIRECLVLATAKRT